MTTPLILKNLRFCCPAVIILQYDLYFQVGGCSCGLEWDRTIVVMLLELSQWTVLLHVLMTNQMFVTCLYGQSYVLFHFLYGQSNLMKHFFMANEMFFYMFGQSFFVTCFCGQPYVMVYDINKVVSYQLCYLWLWRDLSNRDETIRSSHNWIRIDTKGDDMIIYNTIRIVVKIQLFAIFPFFYLLSP